MKIVLIHGQNHKGSTYNISQRLLANLSVNHKIKEFFLPKDLNHFCLGCYSCVEKEEACPFYEDKRKIMCEVEEADLLIVTTPNYCMLPSAQLKAFLDLNFTYWMSHRPRACMFQKRAVVIATTAGAGANKAIKGVKENLMNWGIPVVKTYGIAVQAKRWEEVSPKKKEKIEKDMAKLAKKLSKKEKPQVGLNTRFMFRMMAGMHDAGWDSSPVEKAYWKERGWLDGKRPWK